MAAPVAIISTDPAYTGLVSRNRTEITQNFEKQYGRVNTVELWMDVESV